MPARVHEQVKTAIQCRLLSLPSTANVDRDGPHMHVPNAGMRALRQPGHYLVQLVVTAQCHAHTRHGGSEQATPYTTQHSMRHCSCCEHWQSVPVNTKKALLQLPPSCDTMMLDQSKDQHMLLNAQDACQCHGAVAHRSHNPYEI
jgi:hypothetical protein